MKKLIFTAFSLITAMQAIAQGWPSGWQGVMLQGFYWDSYADSQWSRLESQADELAEFFKLVWVPQSGNCGSGNSMGYNDLYWFSNYNSSFGNEQQLRSMITTFKQKGIGTIADVVVNHRASMLGTWMSFPEETYNGTTYAMGAADVCANDDGGKTAAQAEVKPTGANDTGEDFDGFRDLDHNSPNVQATVKAYLDFLLNDLGYEGFRYDMVKGYDPSFTGLYNSSAKPRYSVGEYWDGNYTALMRWVDGTAVGGTNQSAAFDFALKYLLRDCCNAGYNWNKLAGGYLAYLNAYKRYAVTFVDNHDTYGRGNDSETKSNILAANAFVLAAPGSPCVFLPHWKAYKKDIKQMIYARNAAGISNESATMELASAPAQYAMKTEGTDGRSVVVIMGGQDVPGGINMADYQLVSKGDNYSFYISKNAETVWADVPSGTYDQAVSVTLNALTATPGAQIVYTTDGSTPSDGNGTKVQDGATVAIDGNTTLKAAILAGGAVDGLITRTYAVSDFKPHDVTVYVKAAWPVMYYHSWDSEGNGTTWPGAEVTEKRVVDGEEWYCKSYTLKSSEYYFNLVLNQGSNAAQTVDITNISTDKFYEISDSKDGAGHFYVNDVTDQHTSGISNTSATSSATTTNADVYAIDGRLVRHSTQNTSATEAVKGLKPGLYIVGGKTAVVK